MAKNNKKVAVIVEGTRFESITSAAKYLGVVPARIWDAAHGSGKLKDLAIKFENPAQSQALSLTKGYQSPKKTRKDKRNCPVFCETLNKKFKTISAASKFAGVNGWTMGVKMQTAGQFIDKKGNVYKRLKPMNTDKTYTNTGDTLQKEVKKHSKAIPIPTVATSDVKPEQTSGIALAKKVLKDKVSEFINRDEFKMAKELLDAIEQIKE